MICIDSALAPIRGTQLNPACRFFYRSRNAELGERASSPMPGSYGSSLFGRLRYVPFPQDRSVSKAKNHALVT